MLYIARLYRDRTARVARRSPLVKVDGSAVPAEPSNRRTSGDGSRVDSFGQSGEIEGVVGIFAQLVGPWLLRQEPVYPANSGLRPRG